MVGCDCDWGWWGFWFDVFMWLIRLADTVGWLVQLAHTAGFIQFAYIVCLYLRTVCTYNSSIQLAIDGKFHLNTNSPIQLISYSSPIWLAHTVCPYSSHITTRPYNSLIQRTYSSNKKSNSAWNETNYMHDRTTYDVLFWFILLCNTFRNVSCAITMGVIYTVLRPLFFFFNFHFSFTVGHTSVFFTRSTELL